MAKANREFIYSDDDYFTPIGAKGAQEIVIGSDEADIDIYGVRIYKNQQLGSTQIQNDYMAVCRLLRIRKRLSDSILFSMVRKLAMTFAMQWV